MRLHVGCGKRCIPGFVHVDLADFPHIDHKHDVADLSFLGGGVASLIYASHVVEYFDRVEAVTVLGNWRDVLEPGGTLRLAVPDFEKLAQVYRDTGDLGLIVGPLYGRMPIVGAEPAAWIYHRTVYDFPSLKDTLEAAGYQDVRRYDWRNTEHADHDDFSQAYIPHMDKDNGLLISLNVEATRP